MDEQELQWVRAAQGGDADAFGELVKMYHGRIYNLAYGMLRSADDAADVAQQTWVRAWRKLPGFKRHAQFFTWIYRIASNLCLDRVRQRGRAREAVLDETRDPVPSPDVLRPASMHPQPDVEAQRHELQAHFERALAELKPEHRLALTLREVDGLSYEDMAQVMQCRIGTVMSRLFYARKQMQRMLKEWL